MGKCCSAGEERQIISFPDQAWGIGFNNAPTIEALHHEIVAAWALSPANSIQMEEISFGRATTVRAVNSMKGLHLK